MTESSKKNQTEIVVRPWSSYAKMTSKHIAKFIMSFWREFAVYLVPIFLIALVGFQRTEWCWEATTRWTGMLLQVFGFWIVGRVLIGTEALFGGQSISERVRAFHKDFPRRKTVKHHIYAEGLSSGTSFGKATVSVDSADKSIEQRVSDLERKLRETHVEIQGIRKENRESLKELSENLRAKIRNLKDSISDVEEKLKSSAIDGIHWEWLGVALFVIGVILATASPEVSSFLKDDGECEVGNQTGLVFPTSQSELTI